MNNFTNKPNPVETIGRGLRAALHGAAILDTPPSRDNRVNRNAGRTAIAGAILFFGGLVLAASHIEPQVCQSFGRDDFSRYDDPNMLASQIAPLIDGNTSDSDTFDRTLFQLIDGERISVCGEANIARVELLKVQG